MYNRLYNFLEKKKTIFSLKFGFRQKYSTTHALIHLTDKIRHEINKSNYARGIFVDFQKAINIVDHHILLKKVEYYGVREISIKCFASYLSSRKQFISINCYKSNPADVKSSAFSSHIFCCTFCRCLIFCSILKYFISHFLYHPLLLLAVLYLC